MSSTNLLGVCQTVSSGFSTGFTHRGTQTFQTEFCHKKNLPGKQLGKVIFTADQFAQCLALTEFPGILVN